MMRKTPLWLYSLVGTLAVLLTTGLLGCGSGSSGINENSNGLTPPVQNLFSQSGVMGNVHTVPPSTTSTQTNPIAGAVISVQPQGGGTEIARTTTDGSGNYQVVLPPGTYTLVPQPISSTLAPVTGGQNVTVKLKQFTTQDFSYFNPLATP